MLEIVYWKSILRKEVVNESRNEVDLGKQLEPIRLSKRVKKLQLRKQEAR